MSVYTTPDFVAEERSPAADRVLESYLALQRELARRVKRVQAAHANRDADALDAFAAGALSLQLAMAELPRYVVDGKAFACYNDALRTGSVAIRDLLTE